ncbi:MAG: hypothetical protein HC851_09590 [Acaryochloris sp. RU_4_1]|nr:hypothetical protein [Acaryochloris sp. SU_5_25]NJM65885.1 hypothetical protein [Acaryochloris sp. RU_4_1]NJR56725.1 hypothetical protein [Acaryochloris sp. CRU_2_0]
MTGIRAKRLTRKQVRELLHSMECSRIPELDVSGGLFESYLLPDGKVLMNLAGEGGNLYESREELKNWLQQAHAEEERFYTNLPKAHTIFFDQPVNPAAVENLEENLDTSDNLNSEFISNDVEEFELTASDQSHILSFIEYFRPLGFYSEYEQLSNGELAQELSMLWQTEAGRPLDTSDPYLDLELLQWDFARVWWQDVEADVCMGNNVYAATLERWVAISRGVFVGKDFMEMWANPQGSIQINFTLNGCSHHIQPNYNNDWIDLDIVQQINPLIQASGYQFEMVQTGTQIAFITVLTALEKQKLQSERNWQFLT